MRGLRAATVFLTRVPVGLGANPGSVGESVPWFPVVGALVGALTAGVYAGLVEALPPEPSAAVAIAVAVTVTGAFHLDGLADCADALAGGSTVDRRLEILDDPRLGTYGTAAVVLQLVVQVSAVAALEPTHALWALVAAHGLGRGAAIAVMAAGTPARDHGLGVDYLADLTAARVAIGVGWALVAAAPLGWAAAPAVGAVAVVAGLTLVVARRAFGGIGGDVLGAAEQITETGVLLVVLGLR